MKKYLLFFLLAFFTTGLFAQKDDFKMSRHGIQYKIHTENEGPKPQPGDVIRINFAIRNEADSVLQESPANEPFAIQIDSQATNDPLISLVMLMSEKDSATFITRVDSLYKDGQYPPELKAEDQIRFNIKLVEVLDKEKVKQKNKEQYKKDSVMAIEAYKVTEEFVKSSLSSQIKAEEPIIEKYLKENKLIAKRTELGTYYIIQEEGTGPDAKPGAMMYVHYTGRTLDGKVFDSSLPTGQPFPIRLGLARVITGWNDALRYFGEGDKGMIIIPSPLAYGEQGAGEEIPPHAPLIFDIQIVSVK